MVSYHIGDSQTDIRGEQFCQQSSLALATAAAEVLGPKNKLRR